MNLQASVDPDLEISNSWCKIQYKSVSIQSMESERSRVHVAIYIFFVMVYLHNLYDDPYQRWTYIQTDIGDNKVSSGALEYKSLFIYESCQVTVDFCEWLFSYQPFAIVLKAFHFNADLVNIYGTLAPPETAFLCSSYVTILYFRLKSCYYHCPIFHEFPSPILHLKIFYSTSN